MKSIPRTAIAGLIALAMIGCSRNDEAPVQGKAAAPTQSPQMDTQPSNQGHLGSLLITLNSMKPYTETRYSQPESGGRYYSFDITAENQGAENVFFSFAQFKLGDSDGYSHESAVTSGPEPKLDSYTILPQQKVRGYVVFAVGPGRRPVELQFQFRTGAGRIRLGSQSTGGSD